MTDMICLNKTYSTTRLLTREQHVVENKPEDKFENVLFLPKGEDRKGEGGLRTQGYFKKSGPENPLITVITVVFNGEQFLEETILSVINQTYDNVEYIIIDGGSMDGSLDVIRKYDYMIDYWVSENDVGIYDAMNKAMSLALGEYLIHINAGDELKNIVGKVFEGDAKLKNIDLIVGNAEYVSGKTHVGSINNIYAKNTIHHQAAFYKRSIMKKIGMYDLRFDVLADYHQNIRFLKNTTEVLVLNEVFSKCDDTGISCAGGYKNYHEEIIIRNEMLGKNFFSKVLALYSLTRYFFKKIQRVFWL